MSEKLYRARMVSYEVLFLADQFQEDLNEQAKKWMQREIQENGIIDGEVVIEDITTPDQLKVGEKGMMPWSNSANMDDSHGVSCVEWLRRNADCDGKVVEIEGKKYRLTKLNDSEW